MHDRNRTSILCFIQMVFVFAMQASRIKALEKGNIKSHNIDTLCISWFCLHIEVDVIQEMTDEDIKKYLPCRGDRIPAKGGIKILRMKENLH